MAIAAFTEGVITMGKPRFSQLCCGLLLLGSLTSACGDPTAPSGIDEAATSTPETVPETVVTPLPDAADAVPTALANTEIIPGERFGPVSPETSRADLVALFGPDALEDVAVAAGEGTTEPGTRVDLGPEQSFSVVWVDDTQTRPLLVKDFGSVWRTPAGIGLGMTAAELEAVLGPFDFYGFGWDYGGTVVLEGTALDEDYGLLIIRLQPDSDGNTAPSASLQAVMGDRIFNSTDVNLSELGVTVDMMILYLNAAP
ncbi:MAG: hypothetical protein HC812_19370 [Leptolyngbya sp. RL_3_1]|nr:hypothetical protein [Leptolyngbya sp. RL_3_1]